MRYVGLILGGLSISLASQALADVCDTQSLGDWYLKNNFPSGVSCKITNGGNVDMPYSYAYCPSGENDPAQSTTYVFNVDDTGPHIYPINVIECTVTLQDNSDIRNKLLRDNLECLKKVSRDNFAEYNYQKQKNSTLSAIYCPPNTSPTDLQSLQKCDEEMQRMADQQIAIGYPGKNLQICRPVP